MSDLVHVNPDYAVRYIDSSNIDAYGRLRVGQSVTLFASPATYGHNDIQWEKAATGAGVTPAFDTNIRMSLLKVAAGGSGGTSYIVSRAYHPYRPGKSLSIAMTFVPGAAVAGAVKRFGLGDDNNGLFFEQNGTSGLQFNRRTKTSGSVVNNVVTQANWNMDKLDGTGPSRVTLDPTKMQLMVLDLQYLGIGRVRVGFIIDTQIIYAHAFLNANILSVPYIQQAMLPILSEIVAASALASDATAYFKCAEASSEGGFEEFLGYPFSAEGTVTAANGARTHILSIRPKTTFNSCPNRALTILEALNVLVTDASPIKWEAVIGAAFSVAPTFADVNTTYSSFEFGTDGTFSNLTNGIVLMSGYCNAAKDIGQRIHSDIANRVPIVLNRAGAQTALGTLSILVTGIGGVSATRASLSWKEVR